MKTIPRLACTLALASFAFAQKTVIVRPQEIDDVLVNPGIGFMTFQRFNGDALNAGLKWTEGYPIVYQEFKGSLENRNHPATSIAYFRIYWKFVEPERGKYNWALLGAWGEGAGSELLSQPTREALADSYLEGFPKSPLVMLLTDAKTNKYGVARRDVGWRADCLGDMGGFGNPAWSHMQDAWKKAPVTLEVCWVMQHWKDKGWDVDYIIDQSLKWHISSFNGKSSAVPEEWWPSVNRWLKKMGYRFVLRKFTYPSTVRPQAKLAFTTWWENKGVAPCYREFPLALRLKNSGRSDVMATGADIRSWLPGDIVYDDGVFVPADLPPGEYDLSVALVDPVSREPKVKLAIAGMQADGWYSLGKIEVRDK